MKVLFVGNSLAYHGEAPELGWYGNHGMAASSKENDFVHVLTRMIEAKCGPVETMVAGGVKVEREPAAVTAEDFAHLRAFDPDIIVARLCENVPAGQLEAFGKAYVRMLRAIDPEQNAKIFCTGSYWPSKEADFEIQTAASLCGGIYVPLDAVHGDAFKALGEYAHEGVAAHPNDAGMKAIAGQLFAAIDASGALDPATVYPIPDGEPISGDYQVTVDGQPAGCYTCHVSAMPFNREWPGHQRPYSQGEQASFLYFDMSAPARLTVRPNRAFTEAVLRPLSKGIELTAADGAISFTIRKPGHFSLEIDGRRHNLHIFANPKQAYARTPDTLYFGPGVHKAGPIVLHSGQTLFVDAGAVVKGFVQCVDSSNVRIVGRGILDCAGYDRHVPLIWEEDGLMNLARCENVLVDGVILRDSNWWSITAFNCVNLHYNNVKTIGMWRYNTDGFDFVNCQNVRVTNCFLRNFDDVIVLKGLRVEQNDGASRTPLCYERMNVQNFLVENCVIWCDWGGGLELGAETVADEYCNLVFRNCDILRNDMGALRIHSGDRAVIHHLTYENINVEYSRYDRAPMMQTSDEAKYEPDDMLYTPAVICGWMYCGRWSNDNILGNVYDITYKNIRVYADEGFGVPPIYFRGASPENRFDRITIDGLYFNGKRLTAADVEIEKNEFTGDITLK